MESYLFEAGGFFFVGITPIFTVITPIFWDDWVDY
jgi:hypothetical protein